MTTADTPVTDESWADREVESMGPWAREDDRVCFRGAMVMALEYGLTRPQVRAVFQNAYVAAARDGAIRGPVAMVPWLVTQTPEQLASQLATQADRRRKDAPDA